LWSDTGDARGANKNPHLEDFGSRHRDGFGDRRIDLKVW
jgi:hypothetical protein